MLEDPFVAEVPLTLYVFLSKRFRISKARFTGSKEDPISLGQPSIRVILLGSGSESKTKEPSFW